MEINTLPKNQWVKEEIKGEIKSFLETKGKHNIAEHMECSKMSSKGEFLAIHAYITKQSKRTEGNIQPTLDPPALRIC